MTKKRRKRQFAFILARFLFISQIVLAIVEVVFSAACNPRLWNVAWIAVSAAAEIFIYLVLALATVFVAIIINIYEGSRRDVTFEGEGQSDRETMPKGILLVCFKMC